jgi:hypothetical protein
MSATRAPAVAALLASTPEEEAAAAAWVDAVPVPTLELAAARAVRYFTVEVPLRTLVGAAVGQCDTLPGLSTMPIATKVVAQKLLRKPLRDAIVRLAEDTVRKPLATLLDPASNRTSVRLPPGHVSALVAAVWDGTRMQSQTHAVHVRVFRVPVRSTDGSLHDMAQVLVSATPKEDPAWCVIQ